MKNTSVRPLMLSCLTVVAAYAGMMPAQAQQMSSSEQAAVVNDINAAAGAVNAANAAATYTGNPAQAPVGGVPTTPGGPLVPSLLPGQTAPEVPVTMRYDKKDAEGSFYGVELPERLFNNVPSDW